MTNDSISNIIKFINYLKSKFTIRNTEEILEAKYKERYTMFIKHRADIIEFSVNWFQFSKNSCKNNSNENLRKFVGIKTDIKVYMIVQMSELFKCNSKKNIQVTQLFTICLETSRAIYWTLETWYCNTNRQINAKQNSSEIYSHLHDHIILSKMLRAV